jgi:hypothetical protein
MPTTCPAGAARSHGNGQAHRIELAPSWPTAERRARCEMEGSNGGRSFKEEQSIEVIRACNEGQPSGEDGEAEIGGGGTAVKIKGVRNPTAKRPISRLAKANKERRKRLVGSAERGEG